MKKLKPEYFDDKAKAGALASKFFEAIPPGEYYHVIVMALQDVLTRIIQEWMREENNNRWYGDKP